jgi:hypothetical protein
MWTSNAYNPGLNDIGSTSIEVRPPASGHSVAVQVAKSYVLTTAGANSMCAVAISGLLLPAYGIQHFHHHGMTTAPLTGQHIVGDYNRQKLAKNRGGAVCSDKIKSACGSLASTRLPRAAGPERRRTLCATCEGTCPRAARSRGRTGPRHPLCSPADETP